MSVMLLYDSSSTTGSSIHLDISPEPGFAEVASGSILEMRKRTILRRSLTGSSSNSSGYVGSPIRRTFLGGGCGASSEFSESPSGTELGSMLAFGVA